jgi:hypothetical protein
MAEIDLLYSGSVLGIQLLFGGLQQVFPVNPRCTKNDSGFRVERFWGGRRSQALQVGFPLHKRVCGSRHYALRDTPGLFQLPKMQQRFGDANIGLHWKRIYLFGCPFCNVLWV